jgi:two-component system, NarL family, response regulator DevR
MMMTTELDMVAVTTGTIRVFLVDDHPLIRDGVSAALSAHPHIEVVGEAATVAEALSRVGAVRPDVALLDVQLPDGRGVELCASLRERHPQVACLILTSSDDKDTLFEAIQAGAAGYLLKHARSDRLVEAIERVARGESFIDESLTPQLIEGMRSPTPAADTRISALTPLERLILKHLAAGLTNKQIAAEVHVSTATVKNYVSSILRKLNMSRRTEAAVLAARLGEI